MRDTVRTFVREECHPAKPAPLIISTRFCDCVAKHVRKVCGAVCAGRAWRYGIRAIGQCAGANGTRRSFLGALSPNTQGPDDATMLTLLEHGTDDQKERFETLLNGEKRFVP